MGKGYFLRLIIISKWNEIIRGFLGKGAFCKVGRIIGASKGASFKIAFKANKGAGLKAFK